MAIAPRALVESPLNRATSLLAIMQLELETKGYPSNLVAIALSRARGTAEYKSQPISPEIRGRAFLDLLWDELKGVEPWMQAQQAFLEGQTIDDSE